MTKDYSYDELISIADNIMCQCFNSSGESLDIKSKSPSDVSRIGFLQYTGSKAGELKMFLYSKDRKTNNKPYVYNKKVSRKKYNLIQDVFDTIAEFEVDSESDLDDLIIEDF